MSLTTSKLPKLADKLEATEVTSKVVKKEEKKKKTK